ncbi:hypothetical protein RHODGE_RHODGE_03303 [Rhodoplanes serenus]|uniref:GcrA cell cycle regulator n=1 Tax=Rhodoplanes serenus TaxID=200615 RepID=A0A447CXV6_9BRAD|nr:GcrA family cell cycle regulator [Rhodoplanes serenus]VCU10117.1 hypothetical protein RHODGE_RHODGE_03303 [Rhodoplanes serenus]
MTEPVVLHDSDAPPERASPPPSSLWAQWPVAAERAIALYRDGQSASQIAWLLASDYGVTVTRSAVLGLMRRRGVRRSERHGVTVVTQRMRAVAKGRTIKVRCAPQALPPPARDRAPARPEAAPAAIAGPPGGVALLDLQRGHCRFPLWPDDAPAGSERRFCGARRRDPDAPLDHYCPEHARLCWVAPYPDGRR